MNHNMFVSKIKHRSLHMDSNDCGSAPGDLGEGSDYSLDDGGDSDIEDSVDYDDEPQPLIESPTLPLKNNKKKLPDIPPHYYSKGRRDRLYNDLASNGGGNRTKQSKQKQLPPGPTYAWGDDIDRSKCPHDESEYEVNGESVEEKFSSPSPSSAASVNGLAPVDTPSPLSSPIVSYIGSGDSGKNYKGKGKVGRGGSPNPSPIWESPVRMHETPSSINTPSSVNSSPNNALSGIGNGIGSPIGFGVGFGLSSPSPEKIPRPTLLMPPSTAGLSSGLIRNKKSASGQRPGQGQGNSTTESGMYFAFPSTGGVNSPEAAMSPLSELDAIYNTGMPSTKKKFVKSRSKKDKDKDQKKTGGVCGEDGNIRVQSAGSDLGSEALFIENDQVMAKKLQSIHDKLVVANREGSMTRMALLGNADSMVSKLPLKYLYGKPELRHYALERAMKPFIKLAIQKINVAMKRAFDVWRVPPACAELNESQVGFLVIATFLSKMLTPVYTKAFMQWAKLYSSRFQKDQDIMRNAASAQIADWYRHCRITRRKLFKFFTEAVKVCMDRRKAIKHSINFEVTRRSSLTKFVRTIAKRRRNYFAARSIIRPYLWFKLYPQVRFRLTRLANVRILQRWFRMTRYRLAKERYLIGKILYFGGYSVVFPKVPEDLIRRNGFLNGFDQCSSRIQRCWFRSKGNFAAFMVAAARRAKEEYMQMRNDNALIIQFSWRGVLWNILNTTAKEWNSQRKMFRVFRHYQYRCWLTEKLKHPGKHPHARKIQRWIRTMWMLRMLHHRFLQRKVLFIWTNVKRTFAAFSIQNAWEAHLERERIKLEEFRKWVAEQRANAARTARMIVKIQEQWRKKLKVNTFPRHVFLIMWRLRSEKHKEQYLAAVKIQRMVRPMIAQFKAWIAEDRLDAANVIWNIAKCYNLKLAIWDRVEATILRKCIAVNLIHRNFRRRLFNRHIRIRCILRVHQKNHAKLVFRGATYIQRWIKRKFGEYYIPVRAAARYEVAAKKRRELGRRLEAIRQKAAPFIVRFFRLFKPYNYNVARIKLEWLPMRRIHAARTLQKFSLKVIAWARFDKIVAYRQKLCDEHEIMQRMHHAANIIGVYYKRKYEKFELTSRFHHRKNVLAEYRRLEELKCVAYFERDVAIEDKRRTDENMRATIAASWKQGSDITGKNYYYNYVTGESCWDPPDGWVVPVAHKKWMKQMDERANVYYYNMETQESSWLPPCNQCGEPSEKHCQDCESAYCDRCYDSYHCLDEKDDPKDEEQQQLKLHKWALVEYEKEICKPGEIYCIECKRRVGKKMCLTCWDTYCDQCFRYTHHTGNLKYHKSMAYQKAKLGWMCIKATAAGESDYYQNGSSGVTSYEKPWDLMSENERRLYDDFLSHQKAATDHVQTIKELQEQLEEASFERDSILQDAMNAGFLGGSVTTALKKKKSKKQMDDEDAENAAHLDVVKEVQQKIKPGFFDWFTGKGPEYQKKLLKPKERERGATKSDYMAKLITDIAKQTKADKEAERLKALE